MTPSTGRRVALGLALLALGAARGRSQPPKPRATAPALDVEEWLVGPATTLEALRGKVVMLEFFQIACPACQARRPHVQEMARRYADQGLEVISVATAFELRALQSPARIREYVAAHGYQHRVAIDRNRQRSFRRYQARGTPWAVLIDRAGVVRASGFYGPEQVARVLPMLLQQPAPAADP